MGRWVGPERRGDPPGATASTRDPARRLSHRARTRPASASAAHQPRPGNPTRFQQVLILRGPLSGGGHLVPLRTEEVGIQSASEPGVNAVVMPCVAKPRDKCHVMRLLLGCDPKPSPQGRTPRRKCRKGLGEAPRGQTLRASSRVSQTPSPPKGFLISARPREAANLPAVMLGSSPRALQ